MTILPKHRIRSESLGDIHSVAFESPSEEADKICAGVEAALRHWENPVVRDALDKLIVVAKMVDSELVAERELKYHTNRHGIDFSKTLDKMSELIKAGIISPSTALQFMLQERDKR